MKMLKKRSIRMYDEAYNMIKKLKVSKLDIHLIGKVKYIVGLLMMVFICTSSTIVIKNNAKKAKLKSEICSLNSVIDSLNIAQSIKETKDNQHRLMTMYGEYSTIKHNHQRLTERNLYNFLEECGAWYPDVLMGIAVCETEVGKAGIGKTRNNIFCMQTAKSRKLTTQNKAVCGKYGYYDNWHLCAIDMVFWEETVFSGIKPSREAYLTRIGNTYAKDSTGAPTKGYIEKVRMVSERYR